MLMSGALYGVMVVAGAGGAKMLGVPVHVSVTAEALAQGVVWAVPMVALMLTVSSERAQRMYKPLRATIDFCVTSIVPTIGGVSVRGLAFLSACAGIGEEMFFRGLGQGALAAALAGAAWCAHPQATAIAVVSLIFGLLHAATPAYGVLATLAGAYLGFQYVWCDNLLAPVLSHALYDFAAFLKLRDNAARRLETAGGIAGDTAVPSRAD